MAAPRADHETIDPLPMPAVLPLPVAIAPPQGAPASLVRGATGHHPRGAVSAGVAAAGTHVGRSFRTVGRTLKRVF
jgi:hypothetical protein